MESFKTLPFLPLTGVSSTAKALSSIRRASQGTTIPSDKTIISPGTSRLLSVISVIPSRVTLAFMAEYFLGTFKALDARDSRRALIITSKNVTPANARYVY